jgi:lysophospholipase L1-like esterase
MSGTQFILYGDSRTSSSGLVWTTPVGGSSSTDAYGYAGWLSAYTGGEVLYPSNGDYAITGGGQAWQDQVQDMINSPVQNVIANLGHNWAAYSNTPPPTAALDEAAIATILDELGAAGKQVFLVSEMPINIDSGALDAIHAWLDDPNGASAGRPWVHVINVWDDFVDPNNPTVINPALTYDGVHLNAAGSQILAQDLATYLAPYLTDGSGLYLPTSASDAYDPVSNRDGELIKNFMFQGTGGTVGAGTSGQIATSWSSSVRYTDGLTITLSKDTDASGNGEQVVHITGTPTLSGGTLTLQVVTNVSGIPIGDTLRGAVMVDYPSSSTGILDIMPNVFLRFADGSQAITRGLAGSQYPISSGFDAPLVVPDIVMTQNLTQITYSIIVSFSANTPVDATLSFSQADLRDITREPGEASAPVVLANTNFQGIENKTLAITSSQLLANAIDPLGNAMSITGVNSATGGTVSLVNGHVEFAPKVGFTGTGTFQFIVTDSTGGSTVGHASVLVAAAPSSDVGIDFNGDGIADILFYSSDGTASQWELNSSAMPSGSGFLGTLGTKELIGTGDFNGDGTTDILLRDPTGLLSIWTVSGGAFTGSGTISTNPGSSLVALGTGDFNGDGKSDILFRNSLTGDFSTWDMNLNGITGGGTIGNPGANWVYKAAADFNGDGKTDLLFQNADGSYGIWTLNDFSITGGGAIANPGADWFYKGVGDFNGDGKADLLFQNTDGTYAIWDMNGTTITGGGSIANPGPGWTLVGIGDYNGDGKSDLLFENTYGTLAIWELNNTTISNSVTLGTAPAGTEVWSPVSMDFTHLVFQDSSTGAVSSWEVGLDQAVNTGALGTPTGLTALATGDFAGTGETDVLFTDGSGTLSYWSTNGVVKLGEATIGALPAGATFKATGDFNGDGHTDILYANSDGSLATWDLSGSHIVGGGTLGTAAGYSVVGTGDFNGDGKTDILFKDGAGDLAVWLMNDTTIIGGGVIGNPGSAWTLKGTGDFNGDGKTDLLFEDTSGNYAIWDMNGTTIIGGGSIGNPGGSWELAKIVDLNQDGKSDLLFVDASGHYVAWLMSDTTIIGGGATVGTASSNLHLI